jgi:alkylhydroperoxidase family enzyme
VSEDKLRDVAVFATSPHYAPAERVALAFAEAMTVTGRKVTDELFAEARRHLASVRFNPLVDWEFGRAKHTDHTPYAQARSRV